MIKPCDHVSTLYDNKAYVNKLNCLLTTTNIITIYTTQLNMKLFEQS